MRRSVATLAAAIAALCLLGTGTAAAATATFGANLARTPDNTETCVGPNMQLIVQAATCTVESTNIVTGESGFPPKGEGIVSNVRIRVGPRTGPMQIVLEQALREPNPFEPGKPNYACCTMIAASPVFTPAANAITTVPVNFRVLQSITPDPNGYYIDQHLALSVLDPTVPIPASRNPNAFIGAWVPAWSRIGEQRVGPAGSFLNADVLINADWDPVPGGGEGAGVGTSSVLQVPRRVRPVRNDRTFIPLVCGLDRACAGRLLLQSRQGAGGAAARVSALAGASANAKKKGKKGKKRRTITYASVKFRIPAGKRKSIRAQLRKAGKRLMKKHKRAKVWLNVRMRGAEVDPVKLTLKRAGAKMKSKK